MKVHVCAIIKNEGRYIAEWLAFHIAQGVQHFVLYDNDSTDNTRDVLRKFQAKGYVTLIAFPGETRQMAAYRHYCKYFHKTAKWTAFIDADEFLYCTDGKKLQEYLSLVREDAGVLAVHWYFYGSSGQDMYSREYVTSRFLRRAAAPDVHVKSLVNHTYFFSPGNDPHTFRTSSPLIVNENMSKLPGEYARNENPTAEFIRINHYHTKSKEEARIRWLLKRSDNGEIRPFDTCFKAYDINTRSDISASKFRPEITKILNELGLDEWTH